MHCTLLTLGVVAAIMVGSSSGAVHHYRIPVSGTSDSIYSSGVNNGGLLKDAVSGISSFTNTRGRSDLSKDSINGVSGVPNIDDFYQSSVTAASSGIHRTGDRGLLDNVASGVNTGGLFKDAISGVSDRTQNRGDLLNGIINNGVSNQNDGVIGSNRGAISGVVPRNEKDKAAVRRRSLLHRRKGSANNQSRSKADEKRKDLARHFSKDETEAEYSEEEEADIK